MTRDERHRWLFAHMEGRRITFKQKGMPFRVMRPNAVFSGVAYLNDTKCRIRIVHKQDTEKGKRYEVRFPDREYVNNPRYAPNAIPEEGKPIEEPMILSTLPIGDTTLVGYMEIAGNWKAGEGRCWFHPIHDDVVGIL